SVLTAAQIRRLERGAKRHKIIIFKNQLSNLPARGRSARARASAASASQAGVRAELAKVGATHVHSFTIINAVSATITPGATRLRQHNPAVRAIAPDAFRRFASLGSGPGPALPAMAGRTAAAAGPSSAQPICPSNPAQPLIEPEAREVMNVAAANQIANG